jgi:hypothetical protein
MVLTMGVSQLQGIENSGVNFWQIWCSVIRASFDATEVTSPASTVGSDDSYFKSNSNRREANMNEIDLDTADGQVTQWTLAAGFGSGTTLAAGKMVATGAYLKGVEYRVVNKNSMQVSWNSGACRSELTWTFQMCKGCECVIPDGTKGIISSGLSHGIVANDGTCAAFFVKFDKMFREYMAGVRAGLLSVKATCCNPWDSDIVSAISGKTVADCTLHANTPNYGNPVLNGNAALMSGWGNVDTLSGSTFSLCPAILADGRKEFVCGGANTPTPAPTSGGSSGVSFPLIHSDHSDVTASYKSKLHLSCTRHVVVHPQLLEGEWRIKGWTPLADKGWLNWMSDRPRFGGKIICAEGPSDGADSGIEDYTGSGNYPDAAREAFALAMGGHYFSPNVAEVSTSTSGKYVEFELGCGGNTLELEQYYSGKDSQNYGQVTWWKAAEGTTRKDPDGNDVTGKIGSIKMDGGEMELPGSQWADAPTLIEAGLLFRRRRNNTPGFLPVWQGCRSSNGNFGKYRPDLGGTSSTCCPPKGLLQYAWTDLYHQVPEAGDWRMQPEGLAVPCFRGMFGETQSCRSKLYLHISTCDTCNCVNADGTKKVLVNVDTRHGLVTANAACKLWFSQVDAGIRSYIGALRKLVISDKLENC